MISKKINPQYATDTGSYRISKWSGLKARIALSYVLVTVTFMLLLEAVVVFILILVVPSLFFNLHIPTLYLLKPLFGSLFISLLITTPIGGFFGMLTTRGVVDRLHSLVVATSHFANGNYTQRVCITRQDEIGQLEQHFNLMAEQLAESTSQRLTLIDQNARLAERTRISRDLHDRVKQQMFAVSMQIAAALSHLEHDSTRAHKHMTEAELLTHYAQQELTALIQELRSATLQDKGLTVALQEYVTAWSRQNTIKVDLDIHSLCILPFTTEEALLRVTQEALSNIARHSQATTVQLQLECTQKQVMLSIVDNGNGFDINRHQKSGFGLQSMKERIETLHGKIVLCSSPGQGTSIFIHCPTEIAIEI